MRSLPALSASSLACVPAAARAEAPASDTGSSAPHGVVVSGAAPVRDATALTMLIRLALCTLVFLISAAVRADDLECERSHGVTDALVDGSRAQRPP